MSAVARPAPATRPSARFSERLLVVSGVVHYRHAGRVHAYTPYARELELWADLFREVVVAAPCRDAAPPDDCAAVARENVTVAPLRELAGVRARDRFAQALALPGVVLALGAAMRGAGAVHVRCPGSLGGVGAVLAPLLSRRVVAKYAGQWTGYPGEPLSYRVQRRVLASRWWHGPVTVYGRWPGQPPHVTPFFSAALSEAQLDRARRAAAARRFGTPPLRVLYVGRLAAPKRADAVLDAVAAARRAGTDVTCTVVGDGPERAALERRAESLGIPARFAGALPTDGVLAAYEAADVLALVSESEGWPKGIAEAMAFGLVCVGSARGYPAQLLAGGRGRAVPAGDAAALARVLAELAADPAACREASARAAAWAQRFSLERLRDELGDLVARWWASGRGTAGGAR
jgi:hypothetical protein